MIGRFCCLALVLVCAALGQTPAAKPLPDESLARVMEILTAIYQLDYARAEALCRKMIADAPENPAGYVYLARNYWSEELSRTRTLTIERYAATDFFSESPDQKVYVPPDRAARFRRASEQAIEKSRALLRRNPSDVAAQYLLGIAFQNQASWEFSIDRSWWKAARSGNNVYDSHRELLRRRPDLIDALLATGTYKYIAGSLPWGLRWLSVLLGYHGDRDQGRRELETVAQKGILAADDARTLLAVLYTREKNYSQARAKLADLHARYPVNHLLHLDMGAIDLLLGQPARAMDVYRQILARNYPRLDRAVVLSRLGATARLTGDLAGSERALRQAISAEKASPRSIAVAQLELGKTLDLAGKREEAIAAYRRVLGAEDSLGLHQEAERLIRRRFERR